MRDEARGITLIELIVVIAIIAILAAVAGFEFRGWIARYKVESQITQMHADLMSARVRAMQGNALYIIELANNSYTICEDTNGNNVCDNPGETGTDVSQALSKPNLRYRLNWGLGGGGNRVFMDRRGIITPTGDVWSVQDVGAIWPAEDVDYDCVTVADTRINLGKYDGAICQARL